MCLEWSYKPFNSLTYLALQKVKRWFGSKSMVLLFQWYKTKTGLLKNFFNLNGFLNKGKFFYCFIELSRSFKDYWRLFYFERRAYRCHLEWIEGLIEVSFRLTCLNSTDKCSSGGILIMSFECILILLGLKLYFSF